MDAEKELLNLYAEFTSPEPALMDAGLRAQADVAAQDDRSGRSLPAFHPLN